MMKSLKLVIFFGLTVARRIVQSRGCWRIAKIGPKTKVNLLIPLFFKGPKSLPSVPNKVKLFTEIFLKTLYSLMTHEGLCFPFWN